MQPKVTNTMYSKIKEQSAFICAGTVKSALCTQTRLNHCLLNDECSGAAGERYSEGNGVCFPKAKLLPTMDPLGMYEHLFHHRVAFSNVTIVLTSALGEFEILYFLGSFYQP